MAESKRAGGRGRKGAPLERLTPVNLVVNAVLVFVGAPALVVAAAMLWMGQFGGTDQNQHLFLGAVAILIAIFLVLLSGLKVYEHVRARRRFAELIEGSQKSAVMQNLEELNSLARALGPSYRTRLEARMGELGIKR